MKKIFFVLLGLVFLLGFGFFVNSKSEDSPKYSLDFMNYVLLPYKASFAYAYDLSCSAFRVSTMLGR